MVGKLLLITFDSKIAMFKIIMSLMKYFTYNMKSNIVGHLLGIKTIFVEHSFALSKVN